ncbi:hypothetical protein AUM97_007175 [Cronobacter sakazakii]|nr:hypothetical protein AUM97_007175 [Cronobacter sakazakii]
MFFGFGYFGESQKEQAFRLQAEEQGGGTPGPEGEVTRKRDDSDDDEKGPYRSEDDANKKTASRRFFYGRGSAQRVRPSRHRRVSCENLGGTP